MGVFCILSWSFKYKDLSVVLGEDGSPLLFNSETEAEEYAKDNLNFEWKVVDLE